MYSLAKFLVAAAGSATLVSAASNGTYTDIHLRVERLLSNMTFLEKLAQTRNYGGLLDPSYSFVEKAVDSFNQGNGGGSISYGHRGNQAYRASEVMHGIISDLLDRDRHSIPVINVADSVNGITLANGTLFPATLSMGQSWNIDLYSKVVQAISIENRAVGIHWVLSPELDLAREYRYGRIGEMYGEDIYHVGQFGISFVENMQNMDKDGFVRVAATVKHWVYGSGTAGINEAPIPGGLNDFWNIHIAPYLAVFEATEPLSIMSAYSSYD